MATLRNNVSRRNFLKQTTSACAVTALSSISGMHRALAQMPAVDDYKSLVCVFLFGGNDQWNTLTPGSGNEFSRYKSIRGGLSLSESALLPIDGGALHPSLSRVRDLYTQGKLGFVRNVGNLSVPTTQDDYFSGRVPVPKDLFSHNHQQEIWQTNRAPVSGTSFPGWGGRMADLLATVNSSQELPPSFTLFGSNYWQAGRTERAQRPFAVSPAGVGQFTHLNFDQWPPQEFARSQLWHKLLQQNRTNLLEQQLASLLLSTTARLDAIRDAIDSAPVLQTPFAQSNPLAMQLRMVAKLISIRQQLGLRRQLFMVALGGFDTHGTQLGSHSTVLNFLDQGLNSFYQSTRELGVSDSVLTFTASEFGRTLTSNGDGTDHAWASDYIVLGDSVRGGRSHGDGIELFPSASEEYTLSTGEKVYGPADVGAGRFIPNYSVEQYGASLARWMGLAESDIDNVFPALRHFAARDLGFLT